MSSAPGIGSGRGFEPVAMTMCLASMARSSTANRFGPRNLTWPRSTSTPLSSIVSARDSGIPLISSFSRSISAGQPRLGLLTVMQWTCACSISCSACAAATSTFFGVQPRLGQVPPRSRSSTSPTFSPAARVGTVTLMPAFPPPMIRTS